MAHDLTGLPRRTHTHMPQTVQRGGSGRGANHLWLVPNSWSPSWRGQPALS
jgi:hypothetical protein